MKYSQNDEQYVVEEYFTGRIGTLLSIGENDGVTLSNTRSLIESGWQGVLVEPSSIAFQRLRSNYIINTNIELFNCAIGSIDGTCVFFDSGTHLNKGDTSLLSTALRKETNRFPGTQFSETVVEMITIDTLLARSKYKRFDFISIDAEGMDLEILLQLDLNKLGVECICIEWNSNKNMRNQIENYIFDYPGFKLISVNQENLIYAK